MKNVLLMFAFLIISIGVNAQSIKKDAAGNYYQDSTKVAKSSAKATGKTFTDKKGVKYPVLLSKNGKLFYVKTAIKSGNTYNVYLK